jgi:hypothetical protein
MSEIVIDSALRARLNGLTEMTAFCDESGRLIGHFVPAVKAPFVPPASDGCPYTPEQLDQFRRETGGVPLAEFWKRMGQK